MLLKACAYLVVALGVAISTSANVDDIWRCPAVNPLNTSLDQLIGDWYFQEMTVVGYIPQHLLCVSMEIRNLETSNSGNKSYTILGYKSENGTERAQYVNRTIDVSSQYPGMLITRGMDHVASVVAETDDRKLICLATCITQSRSILETMIFSRDVNPDPEQIKLLRDKINATGITTEGQLIVRDRTSCQFFR